MNADRPCWRNKTGVNGQWNKCHPDETFMIAASDFVFKCGKNCFTMRIGPLKLISSLE